MRSPILPIVVALTLGTQLSDAECARWTLNGLRGIKQSNKVVVALDVQQNQARFTGTASYNRMVGELKQLKKETGSVEGTVNGYQFNMQVRWRYGETGIYTGTIALDGSVSGTAYIAEDPNNAARKSTWFGMTALKCDDIVVAPKTVPTSPPLESPVKKPSSTTSTNESSDIKRPSIWATKKLVRIPPGRTSGNTFITWDGGTQHPNAEVWVKTESEGEKPVVESGKGARVMKVSPGRNVFILIDSGKRLADVVVEGVR